MEKKTVIDQIEVRRDGTTGVRFLKLLVDDDGTEVLLGYHRTSIDKDTDVDLQMSMVNNHLDGMKAGVVSTDEIKKIREVNDFVKTKKALFDGERSES